MRYLPLAQVTSYYEAARRAQFHWRTVEHSGVQEFSEAVYKLSKLSRQQDDDTGWRQFLYPARRARNILTTVPLPFSSPVTGITGLMEQLARLLPQLRVYAGDEAASLGEAALQAGLELARLDEAPLLDTVVELAAGTRARKGERPGMAVPEPGDGDRLLGWDDLPRARTGLVLPLGDFVGAVRDHLAGRLSPDGPSIAPLTWHDVAESEVFDRLIVIGPLYWYRDHEFVLTSPRASNVVLVKWAWFGERPPAESLLAGSRGKAALRVKPAPVTSSLILSEMDERTDVDWHAVSRELAGTGDGEMAEPVPARPALLAGGFGVLLPEAGERHVWLLDPHAPAEHRAARVDVLDLEPGHVIVLRTSGGGDLIVPLADDILGTDAARLRLLQREWKAKLREWVRAEGGITRGAARLRREGCARANSQNLQNWLSERSLRTEDPADWEALMQAASLKDKAATIWKAMGRLHTAHTEAGLSLGRRLRDLVNTEPLDQLLAMGRQVFSLAHGGSLTAFRIDGFAPVTVNCPPSRLMVPSRIRDEWLT